MLNKDFREFLELLNKNDVDYLVVGGYAVGFHGYPRYTKDIDIWIESSPENASKLLITLEEFGFGSLDLQPCQHAAARCLPVVAKWRKSFA